MRNKFGKEKQINQTINKIDISSSDRQGFHDMKIFFNKAAACERRRGENRAKLNKSKQDIFGIPAVFFLSDATRG